jgi:general secretion pathway protein J
VSRSAPPGAAAGFTLVEMVMALALAGLVSLVLLEGLRLTVSGVGRVSQAADRFDDRASLEAVLRRTLAATAPVPSIDGQPAFVGAPDRLSFVAFAEDGGVGLYRIELGFVGPQSRRELVLTRRLAMPTAAPRAQQSVLGERLGAVRLAYFGAVSPGDPPAWHDRWEGLANPPQLVRIMLEDAAEARPPIVIRLWGAG